MKNLLVIGLCFAVLLGAYLLFTLEPLVGKLVTPGFGGTVTIWSACMLFFQIALLAGYFLAYGLTRLNIKLQVILYAVLLAVSIFFSRPPSLESWISTDINNPALDLIVSLIHHLALPFIVLSSISIMMQTWYRKLKLGNPYPLYSVSNIGSMVALLAYPIVMEPNFTLDATIQLWSDGYIALVTFIMLFSGIVFQKDSKGELQSASETQSTDESKDQSPDDSKNAGSKPASKPNLKSISYWSFLSAAGSLTLLAFTTYITQDIAPIPLLWVLPLAIYLLTFIILFGNPSVYWRRTYALVALLLWLSELFVSRDEFAQLAVVNLVMLFVICMVFHGELVKSRPDPEYLPTFYVSMAFGGAIGGMFVNFIAPMIFIFYAERQLAIALLVGLIVYLVFSKQFRAGDLSKKRTELLSMTGEVVALVMGLLAIVLCAVPFCIRSNIIAEQRNFYSSIQIERGIVDGVEAVSMVHGRVIHGVEFMNAKGAATAGLYWEPVALAFDFARTRAAEGKPPNTVPIKCGIVGLGVGFSAIFGQSGDMIRFYELDPKVKTMAEQYFSYLKKGSAKIEFEIGDGRSLLAREEPQKFDLLIIDAFNGDAIPVHLLTRQAGMIYLKHLNPNGVLMVHASNRYLKLPPVVGKLAEELQLNAATVRVSSSTYIIMCKDPQVVEKLKDLYQKKKDKYRSAVIEPTGTEECKRVWTDDYVNLFPFLQNAESLGNKQ